MEYLFLVNSYHETQLREFGLAFPVWPVRYQDGKPILVLRLWSVDIAPYNTFAALQRYANILLEDIIE
jgi:hypothetical protein